MTAIYDGQGVVFALDDSSTCRPERLHKLIRLPKQLTLSPARQAKRSRGLLRLEEATGTVEAF
jgi:hypothetical protein